MSYFLGVDIGTTSVKAIAFHSNGQVANSFSAAYKMFHPTADRSEQDPDEILRGTIDGINKIVAAQGPPLLISFSSAMHSLIAMDGNGKPLTACMIWADNRATAIAEALRATPMGEAFYHATGAPLHAMLPSCKIAWLRDHRPDIFQQTHAFIGIKEYILYHLLGEYLVDTSIASATGLMNLRRLEWDHQVLSWLGITPAQLPQLVQPLHIATYRSHCKALMLPAGIPLVMGGSDGAMANLGTGAIHTDNMAISIGTSSAARRLVEAPSTDEHMRTFCYHVKGSQYVMGGASNNGAVVLQWLRESVLESTHSYRELFTMAANIAPGAEGLLFIPYILGERAPIWDSKARGIFFGVHISHTTSHFARAVIEGIIGSVYSFGQLLLADGLVRSLHVTGGFADSPLGLQVLADTFNRPVLVSDSVEGSALGAVMVGMEAMGMESELAHRVLAVYEPDAARHAAYSRQMKKFERVYHLLKNEFSS